MNIDGKAKNYNFCFHVGTSPLLLLLHALFYLPVKNIFFEVKNIVTSVMRRILLLGALL